MSRYDDVVIAAEASSEERAAFIRRTYAHLAGAVALFILIEYMFFATGIAAAIFKLVMGVSWLLILGGFMLLSWLARVLIEKAEDVKTQYIGFAAYVALYAVIFAPLLYIAVNFSSPSVLPNAAILTGVLFAGLTAMVFTTRKDFSFLGGILTLGGFLALGLIIVGTIFGFSLGLWFAFAMVALAAAAILYDTSNVLHHFETNQHVMASLELFASLAMLFWYILQIFMASDD